MVDCRKAFVFVGDCAADTTEFLLTFVHDYHPTVFEHRSELYKYGKKTYELGLYDSFGQEDYPRLRPFNYVKKNCIILCYSIGSRTSFENVLRKYHPEIKQHAPDVPLILVGTKSDLRISDSPDFVSWTEGNDMKTQIGAYAFVECSAKKKERINDVIEAAIISTQCFNSAGSSKSKRCTIQ